MAIVPNLARPWQNPDLHWHGNADEVHGAVPVSGGGGGDGSGSGGGGAAEDDLIVAAGGTEARELADHLAEPLLSFKDFGAVGNGTTDDTAAIVAAFASGNRLTGNGATYAVSSNIVLPDNFYLEDAAFKQLDPAGGSPGRRTLTKTAGTGNGTLRRVKINRNGTTTQGTIADFAGIWFANVNDLIFEDVEVTGNGPGHGIRLVSCQRVQLIRPYVHDMQWASPTNPGTEQIMGIGIGSCIDVSVLQPRIARLTGLIGAAPARAFQTDGFSTGGNTNLTIVGGTIEACGEGLDTYSSLLTTNLWIYQTVFRDIDSFGVKLGSLHSSGCVGVRAIRCGFAGFTTGANSTTPVGFQPTNVRFIDCVSISVGLASNWVSGEPISGFYLAWEIATLPIGVQFINCAAVDTVGVGFYAPVVTGLVLDTINPFSVGHTGSFAHVQGAPVSFLPTRFDTLAPNRIGIGSSALPTAHIQLTETAAGAKTLPLLLSNPPGTSGTEVGIAFDPNGYGKDGRDAQIVVGTYGDNTSYISFRTALGGTPVERFRVDNGAVYAPASIYVNGNLTVSPGSAVTPPYNGSIMLEFTSNTSFKIKAKGSDGVVRAATLTLT